MPERLKFLCEHHIGRRIRAVFLNAPSIVFEIVPNDIHHDDNLIVEHANQNDQTIITRDEDFPSLSLCRIIRGVLYIPQSASGEPVRQEDVLDTFRRLLESGRLATLGHGVCTVLPDKVIVKLPSGTQEYPRRDI